MNNKTLEAILALKDKLTPYLKGIRGKIKVFADEIARFAKRGFIALTAAVTASAYALRGLIQDAMTYALELDKMSKETAISTEEFSRLAYAAEQEHSNIEALSKVMPVLAKYMEKARSGTESAKREFERMGVSVLNARGELKSTYQVFLEMSEFYKNATDKTQALAIATNILGKRGAELVPLLKLGKDGIKALGDEAERMGVVLDAETVSALENFGDKIESIQSAIKGAKVAITMTLLPVLDDIAARLKNIDWKDDRIKQWTLDIGEGVIRTIGAILKFMLGLKMVWRTLLAIMETLVAGVSDIVEYFKIRIETMKIAFYTIIRAMIEGLKSFLEKLKPFAKMLKIDIVDAGYNKLSEAIDNFTEKIEASRNSIEQSKATMEANSDVLRDQWQSIGKVADEMMIVENETERYVSLLRTKTKSVKDATQAVKDNAGAIEDAKNKSTAWAETINSLKETLIKWRDDARDLGKALGEVITKTMDDIASGTAKAFRSSLEEGKDFVESMKEMFRNLLFDITEEIIRSGIRALLAELFTFGTPEAGGGGGGIGGLIKGIAGFFTKGHEGGRVTPFGIQKYHRGGFPGLKSDEVLGVLQTGERVLNKKETKEYEGPRGLTVIVNQVIQAWDSADVWRNRDTLALGVADAIKRNSTIREVIRQYA